jgi:hypothetical protein
LAPEAEELLLDYIRLERVACPSLTAACAMLTLCVELQLKWAMSRDVGPANASRIRSAGFSEVLDHLRFGGQKLANIIVVQPMDKGTMEKAGRVARTRNIVHHEFGRLRENDGRDLRQLILGGNCEFLASIATLRCRSAT